MFYGFSEERSQFFRTVKMYLGGVDGCAYQLRKLLQCFPSKVEYMRPIHHPATENATIQEVLRSSQEASQKLEQEHTIITLDLATAKKAYSIIWQDPETYKNVFIRLGTFYTFVHSSKLWEKL